MIVNSTGLRVYMDVFNRSCIVVYSTWCEPSLCKDYYKISNNMFTLTLYNVTLYHTGVHHTGVHHTGVHHTGVHGM